MSFAVILLGLVVYCIKPVTTRVTDSGDSGTDEEEVHVCTDHANFKSVDEREPDLQNQVVHSTNTKDIESSTEPENIGEILNEQLMCNGNTTPINSVVT